MTHFADQSRRDVALGLLAAGFSGFPAQSLASPGVDLRRAAKVGRFVYGAAVEPEDLDGDPAYAALAARQCQVLTPENAMKWDAVRPSRDVFDFRRADRLAEIARESGQAMHGHCLVWHEALPPWVTPTLAAGDASTLLRDHIVRVVSRYRGLVRSWDVVNEAVERNDHRSDGLRRSPWLEALGPEYLDMAFEAAHHADPDAMLAISDYGLEYDDERWMLEKRETVLELLAALRVRGVPIHALALQGHLDASRPAAFGSRLRAFLKDVASLGFVIIVTELDVNDQNQKGDLQTRDAVSASIVAAFLDVVGDEPAVRSISTWGLSDKYSSKRFLFPRADGTAPRPLPFDGALRPKPFAAVLERALERNPAAVRDA